MLRFFGDPNSGDSIGKRNLGTQKKSLDVVDEQLIIQQGQGSSEKEFLDFAEAWSGIHNSNFVEKFLENCWITQSEAGWFHCSFWVGGPLIV